MLDLSMLNYVLIGNTVADSCQWVASCRLGTAVVNLTSTAKNKASPYVARALEFSRPYAVKTWEIAKRSHEAGILLVNAAQSQAGIVKEKMIKRLAPDLYRQYEEQTEANQNLSQGISTAAQTAAATREAAVQMLADAAIATAQQKHAAAEARKAHAEQPNPQIAIDRDAVREDGPIAQQMAAAVQTFNDAVNEYPQANQDKEAAQARKNTMALSADVQSLGFRAAKVQKQLVVLAGVLDRLITELEHQNSGVEKVIKKIKALDMLEFGESQEACDERNQKSCLSRADWECLRGLISAASDKIQDINVHKTALMQQRETIRLQVEWLYGDLPTSPQHLTSAIDESTALISDVKLFIKAEKERYSALIDTLLDQSAANTARLANLSPAAAAASTLLSAVALLAGIAGSVFASKWGCEKYIDKVQTERGKYIDVVVGINKKRDDFVYEKKFQPGPLDSLDYVWMTLGSFATSGTILLGPALGLIFSAIKWSKTNQKINIEEHLKCRLVHEKSRIERLFDTSLNHINLNNAQNN